MSAYAYVAAQDDNKISVFTIDADTGALTLQRDEAMPGGPALLAISPDRSVLYVGHREGVEISSHNIDPATGGLTRNGSVTPEDQPAFLATDRTGRYLLSSYYQGGHIAVHPLGDDGSVGGAVIQWLTTDVGAHAMQTDRSNRFAFVPHIARLQDNVLEPPKDLPGPNVIYQYRFDESTGSLTPNTPLVLEMTGPLGPRHFCFHPALDIVYFSDEQGSSVTGYRLDPSTGTLSAFQTVTSLPAGVTERNTCSQIQMSPGGDFLFVPNRGHNTIASFSVDSDSGELTPAGHAPTEVVPSAFSLDPQGKFVYAAGSATARMASYRIGGSGELTPLETYDVGQRPMWVLTTDLDA